MKEQNDQHGLQNGTPAGNNNHRESDLFTQHSPQELIQNQPTLKEEIGHQGQMAQIGLEFKKTLMESDDESQLLSQDKGNNPPEMAHKADSSTLNGSVPQCPPNSEISLQNIPFINSEPLKVNPFKSILTNGLIQEGFMTSVPIGGQGAISQPQTNYQSKNESPQQCSMLFTKQRSEAIEKLLKTTQVKRLTFGQSNKVVKRAPFEQEVNLSQDQDDIPLCGINTHHKEENVQKSMNCPNSPPPSQTKYKDDNENQITKYQPLPSSYRRVFEESQLLSNLFWDPILSKPQFQREEDPKIDIIKESQMIIQQDPQVENTKEKIHSEQQQEHLMVHVVQQSMNLESENIQKIYETELPYDGTLPIHQSENLIIQNELDKVPNVEAAEQSNEGQLLPESNKESTLNQNGLDKILQNQPQEMSQHGLVMIVQYQPPQNRQSEVPEEKLSHSKTLQSQHPDLVIKNVEVQEMIASPKVSEVYVQNQQDVMIQVAELPERLQIRIPILNSQEVPQQQILNSQLQPEPFIQEVAHEEQNGQHQFKPLIQKSTNQEQCQPEPEHLIQKVVHEERNSQYQPEPHIFEVFHEEQHRQPQLEPLVQKVTDEEQQPELHNQEVTHEESKITYHSRLIQNRQYSMEVNCNEDSVGKDISGYSKIFMNMNGEVQDDEIIEPQQRPMKVQAEEFVNSEVNYKKDIQPQRQENCQYMPKQEDVRPESFENQFRESGKSQLLQQYSLGDNLVQCVKTKNVENPLTKQEVIENSHVSLKMEILPSINADQTVSLEKPVVQIPEDSYEAENIVIVNDVERLPKISENHPNQLDQLEDEINEDKSRSEHKSSQYSIKIINIEDDQSHSTHEENIPVPIPQQVQIQREKAHHLESQPQQLPNIFVNNNHGPQENSLPMMQTFQQQMMPNVPPCISININRYNEISLNIFNNNPQFPEKKSELQVAECQQKNVEKAKVINQNDSTILEENLVIRQPVRVQQSFESIPSTIHQIQNLQQKDNSAINISSSFEKIPNNQSFISKQSQRPSDHLSRSYLQGKNLQTLTENKSSFRKTQREQLVQQKIYNDKIIQTSQRKQQSQSNPKHSQQQINQAYLIILNLADTYLMSPQPVDKNDKEFQTILKPHMAHRLLTYPTSPIGQYIFKDGLILTAIVRLFTQSSKTPFLANYIFDYFESAFPIEHNQFIFYDTAKKAKEEFQKYLEQQYIDSFNKTRNKIQEEEKDKPVVRRSIIAVQEEDRVRENRQRKGVLSIQSNSFFINQKMTQLNEPQKKVTSHINEDIRQQHQKESKEKNGIQVISETSEQLSQTQSISIVDLSYNPKIKSKSIVNEVSKKDDPSERKNTDSVSRKYDRKLSKQKRLKMKEEEESVGKASKMRMMNKQFKVDVTAPIVESQDQIKQSVNKKRDSSAANSSKFNELYEKYRKIRQGKSDSPKGIDSPAGILKNNFEREQYLQEEAKKKKTVQFIEDSAPKGKKNEEESLSQEMMVPRRRKKSKTAFQVEFDGDEVLPPRRTRKHRKL